MVTAARSRHIRFTFIIQNFAQIVQTYGEQEAETIRGNCGNLIYLLTGELKALEEISKLCGDKLVRVGKDKKEETRPLITISELQRMKVNEFILLKQRCYPYKGKIRQGFSNDFGFGKGEDYYGKNVVYPERTMDEIPVFDLKEFINEKTKNNSNVSPNRMPSNNPFLNQSPAPNPFMNDDFDIDEMIKNIDKQIAELEKQEKEEQEKLNAEKENKDSNNESEKDNVKDAEFEEKDIELEGENAPKAKEIVHSNMVDFTNFEQKNDNIETKEENKEKNEEELDDFFDDFFDVE